MRQLANDELVCSGEFAWRETAKESESGDGARAKRVRRLYNRLSPEAQHMLKRYVEITSPYLTP